VKRLTLLLIALFLACENEDETTTSGLPSDEVAWLSFDMSSVGWMVAGTDDSLRFTSPGRPVYWEEACVESVIPYTLRGDSLIINPDTEDEHSYSIALLDSGRVLRQSWEVGDRRWYWDSSLDAPTDCEAFDALAGIGGEFSGSGRLVQGEAPPDTLELDVWAEHGFLWLNAKAPSASRLFQSGARAQPGADTVPLRAGAGAYRVPITQENQPVVGSSGVAVPILLPGAECR
jgi:hypothetical protein